MNPLRFLPAVKVNQIVATTSHSVRETSSTLSVQCAAGHINC